LFPGYLEALLVRLKARGVHVLLETCGYFRYDVFRRKIMPYLDMIYYDVKLADDQAHRTFTGRSNRSILSNLQRLIADSTVEVLPRIPLVPGITDTEENLCSLIRYLRGAGADRVALLPYNPMGIDKYPTLGMCRPDLPHGFMKPGEEERIRALLGTYSRNV